MVLWYLETVLWLTILVRLAGVVVVIVVLRSRDIGLVVWLLLITILCLVIAVAAIVGWSGRGRSGWCVA